MSATCDIGMAILAANDAHAAAHTVHAETVRHGAIQSHQHGSCSDEPHYCVVPGAGASRWITPALSIC